MLNLVVRKETARVQKVKLIRHTNGANKLIYSYNNISYYKNCLPATYFGHTLMMVTRVDETCTRQSLLVRYSYFYMYLLVSLPYLRGIRQAMYVQRNNVSHSSNHCCGGKAIILLCVCVCVCVCV